MSLEWSILINGKHYTSHTENEAHIRFNEMKLYPYVHPCHHVAHANLNPYYPLESTQTTIACQQQRSGHPKTTLNPQDMKDVAEMIVKWISYGDHLPDNEWVIPQLVRTAAWLWSWAEEDRENNRITLLMNY